MEKNGKSLSSKHTKHINIRYFFVTYIIHKGEISLEWCPMGEMIGDFLTKPNQGSTFRIFKDLSMGVMPQTYPSNEKQGNLNKKEARTKVIKS